nr:leucyl aminopeptidase family protein [Aestuariispira insulae]
MMNCFLDKADDKTVTLIPVDSEGLSDWLEGDGSAHQNWVKAQDFKAASGTVLLLPGSDGIEAALVGTDRDELLWSWGGAAMKLPAGSYRIAGDLDPEEAHQAALGWAMGAYRFIRYKKEQDETDVRALIWPEKADQGTVQAMAEGIYLTRDLTTTPASDMGPEELASAAQALAQNFNASVKVTVGEDLLKDNFPLIHAVGRASDRAPRLIDLVWGREDAPKVTLVGKGVCFDTGGLDLKPSNNMLMMKKDMGGAAQVLGLASMIMGTGLDVRLRVLVPAVENSVAGNAFRPMDIIKARNGMTVEIGNTDAEGRLVLADALDLAGEEKPEVIFDFATLTGASRVALGTDVPSFFTDDDELADGLFDFSTIDSDLVWRMPLHKPYRSMLDSKIADISNCSTSGYGGAITAALFLKEFLPKGQSWCHLDVMAWNTATKNGRPEGGEAQGIRAVYSYLRSRFGKAS